MISGLVLLTSAFINLMIVGYRYITDNSYVNRYNPYTTMVLTVLGFFSGILGLFMVVVEKIG